MLPIGLGGLLLSKRWLYRMFVFWTLFSATSAANFGEKENGSALQLWMLFGLIWLIRLILEHQIMLHSSADRRILRPCLWLVAFVIAASFSLIMPLYINGTLLITSPVLFDGSETPLFLTSRNLTQLLYLIFGCGISICVAHSNLKDEERHETERVILFSAGCLSTWGLLQFVCNVTGISYPASILNNSGSISARGYLENLNGVGRLSSAAVEPSIFALSLISLLPLTVPAWLKRGSVFSVPLDRFCAVLFTVLLILSTSSTAYLGFLILGVLLIPVFVRTRSMSLRKAIKLSILTGTAGTAVIGILVVSIPYFKDVISSALLEKAVSGSGMERLMTIGLAFGYFQKFPWLGIGWGSATSHDLIVKLLSNVGIIGTVVFIAAMSSVIWNNWKSLEPMGGPMSLSRVTWFLCFCVFLLASVAIGFPLSLGNFWLLLGMAISTAWKPAEGSLPEDNWDNLQSDTE
jgi:hypothetical protein